LIHFYKSVSDCKYASKDEDKLSSQENTRLLNLLVVIKLR